MKKKLELVSRVIGDYLARFGEDLGAFKKRNTLLFLKRRCTLYLLLRCVERERSLRLCVESLTRETLLLRRE
jgi:hypothetical protein